MPEGQEKFLAWRALGPGDHKKRPYLEKDLANSCLRLVDGFLENDKKQLTANEVWLLDLKNKHQLEQHVFVYKVEDGTAYFVGRDYLTAVNLPDCFVTQLKRVKEQPAQAPKQLGCSAVLWQI